MNGNLHNHFHNDSYLNDFLNCCRGKVVFFQSCSNCLPAFFVRNIALSAEQKAFALEG